MNQKKKWYDNAILTNILLIIFFPVGLYALWKSNTIAKWWKITATSIIIVIAISNPKIDNGNSSSNDLPNNEFYESCNYEWRGPNTSNEEYLTLARILIKYNITGCAFMEVKYVKSMGEYVIACSSDGLNWKYYIVYDSIGKLIYPDDEWVNQINECPPENYNLDLSKKEGQVEQN